MPLPLLQPILIYIHIHDKLLSESSEDMARCIPPIFETGINGHRKKWGCTFNRLAVMQQNRKKKVCLDETNQFVMEDNRTFISSCVMQQIVHFHAHEDRSPRPQIFCIWLHYLGNVDTPR